MSLPNYSKNTEYNVKYKYRQNNKNKPFTFVGNDTTSKE